MDKRIKIALAGLTVGLVAGVTIVAMTSQAEANGFHECAVMVNGELSYGPCPPTTTSAPAPTSTTSPPTTTLVSITTTAPSLTTTTTAPPVATTTTAAPRASLDREGDAGTTGTGAVNRAATPVEVLPKFAG